MDIVLYAYISKQNHELILNKFLLDFPLKFQKKIRNYRRWQDSQSSLLGRILLKVGLQRLGINSDDFDLLYTKYNKPFFKNEDVKFNISHSGSIVVCMISDKQDLGIDIELVRSLEVEEFRDQMTDGEWNLIQHSPNRTESFYKYWTQKEAVVKAHGEGLSISLKSFEIVNFKTMLAGKMFFVKELKIDPNYICHIAMEDFEKMKTSKLKIECFDFSKNLESSLF
ncbi:MAG: 4'-phosphopantetheinyl transferase superfamily protein [Flavobacteriaceae bacterium]